MGPTVTVKLGLTVPHPTIEYANVKPELELRDIDPAGDVGEQIRVGLETAARAFVEIDGQMETVLAEIMAPETGVRGVRVRLDELETLQTGFRETLASVVERLQGYDLPGLVAQVRGTKPEDGTASGTED